ncbi:glycoside hydrolase family 3 protein [Foetidibacter luteolus]|uniref:glycoside hydrolase family 3 protein n=1 Tax=Foetidibacter luteolus TaxID=2608880 RepID=UPI001A9843A4|nr:glycoside hydrolase family 3 N-terminal domain-containing protein [Foetidibacter luteolus]
MKKTTAILLMLCICLASFTITRNRHNQLAKEVAEKSAVLRGSGNEQKFRDLNKNGKMDVYEDATQPVEARISDLLRQMNLEEKAGMMFINGAKVNEDGSIDDKPAAGMFAFVPNGVKQMKEKQMNHFNLWAIPSVTSLAKWYNAMQQYAEGTRLGIPITIASDPRNHFSNNIFSMSANSFSQWCEPLGLAAIGDDELTRQFADISRQEYVAVGIREALHPQIDLATEPRWPRISGTFGEDAQLSARMATAYIKGYQGEKLGNQSVAAMTKHFSGGGPQKEGLDPHFPFQRGQVYPGNNFNYHLIPFEAAFAAHTAAIMPYYGVPQGQTSEEVAFSFNKDIITGLLRNKYKYDGVVCTDWGLITDADMGGVVWPARAWGVENLTPEERVKKVIDAGVDQFGGESCAEHVVSLVKKGKLTEQRIDESIRRLLRQKFELGLFDNPFIDESKVTAVLGKPEFLAAGEASQRRAVTLLKNADNILPLKPGALKIYVQNVDAKVAALYGTVVKKPEEADIAILRLETPFYPVESPIMMARMFHHGDLDFKGGKKDSILQLLKTVPTIVDIYLDRPAVIPEISAAAKALMANFGASDAAVLDVIFGKYKPGGHLPFELPSSMEAVRNQKEDVPYDSKDPLYKFGYGLGYE